MRTIHNENGFGVITAITGIAIAIICGTIVHYLHLENSTILDNLQKLAFIPGSLIILALQLRFKLLDLSGKNCYSLTERRNLRIMIKERTRTISNLIFVYVMTAFVLGISPLLAKLPVLIVLTKDLAAAMVGICIHSFVVILLAFNELEQFQLDLDEREAERIEQEKLLKKLDN